MILYWDIYEIRSDTTPLQDIKLRGKIRKFTMEKEITCLTENASDEKNVVRFALLTNIDPRAVSEFIKNLLPKAEITESFKNISNPVLSKLKVNDSTRYEL
jgi:hypothetical protein